jgi:hypothetical protein
MVPEVMRDWGVLRVACRALVPAFKHGRGALRTARHEADEAFVFQSFHLPLTTPLPGPGHPDDAPTAILDAVSLRHPAGISGRNNGAFVPNDVRLGGDPDGGAGSSPPFLLLSGPNMGGKSTLLRQVCLATVMAQVGNASATSFGLCARPPGASRPCFLQD